MRLNKQDGGCRQCISVTNNEVAADEQKTLRMKGLRPGDAKWELHAHFSSCELPVISDENNGIVIVHQ